MLMCSVRRRTSWRKLWLIAMDTFILGVNPKTGEVRIVILLDKRFQVSSGLRQTSNKFSVLVSNMTRSLCFKTWTQRKTRYS